MTARIYNVVRDSFDPRDHIYSTPRPAVLPVSVDLRPFCPPVLDQLSIGSCSSQAFANADLYAQMQEDRTKAVLPSRLFIYYRERVIEGTVRQDAGAQLRDGIKVLASQGAPPESEWPYDITKYAVDPGTVVTAHAARHKVTSYTSVPQSLTGLKTALAIEKRPIVFGFQVFAGFESQEVARTGIMAMPKPHEQCLGGHAVLLVGYDDARQCFIVMNSWGTNWGDKGYFYMPYAYATNPKLASDFWLIRTVVE